MHRFASLDGPTSLEERALWDLSVKLQNMILVLIQARPSGQRLSNLTYLWTSSDSSWPFLVEYELGGFFVDHILSLKGTHNQMVETMRNSTMPLYIRRKVLYEAICGTYSFVLERKGKLLVGALTDVCFS